MKILKICKYCEVKQIIHPIPVYALVIIIIMNFLKLNIYCIKLTFNMPTESTYHNVCKILGIKIDIVVAIEIVNLLPYRKSPTLDSFSPLDILFTKCCHFGYMQSKFSLKWFTALQMFKHSL